MSKDCLVTKLKATVNNSGLEKLGVFPIYIMATGSFVASNHYVKMGAVDSDVVLKIVGDGHFTNPTGTQDFGKEKVIAAGTPDTTYIYFSDFSGIIEVWNKYEACSARLATGVTISYKAKDVNYTKFTAVSGDHITGYVSELPDTMLSIIISDVAQNTLNGSISDFKKFTELTTINVTGSSVNKVSSGSIVELGTLTKLTSIIFHSMTGTIEAFVAAQRAAGRTSVASEDAITFKYLNETTVTFNGSSISSGDKLLYWDATTITFDGTTITA